MNPQVKSFFDSATFTFTHVAYDRDGGHAVVIDPVLDYDPASARTSTTSADRVLAFIRDHGLTVDWILETHAHADHLTAAAYVKQATGAAVAIGHGITRVQERFKGLFGLDAGFPTDGRQFDTLFADGNTFRAGDLHGHVIATPGHTDDSLTYVIGDAAFVGDTVFAPETGTARTDFPGGDAARLYASIQKILALPKDTRIFLCHDYPDGKREPVAETSVSAQAHNNIHVGGPIGEVDFVAMRRARDATLPPPRLLLPALQVNIRGGRLPEPDSNGVSYLRLPLNQLGRSA